MLKTRLAEKDAQLMGGFGALSNMQLRGSQGWLGGLPDPESIAAALPEQTRPYIHPHLHPHRHPSPPRKSAWGSKHGGDHVFIGSTSSPKGASGLPQQLPALVQSADARLHTVAKSAGSSAAHGWQTQLRRQSAEGPSAPGMNAASAGALQQPEGSSKKPSQARPVLLPLSASQNGMQLPSAARSSMASSRDSFRDESVSPAQASTAASAAAIPMSSTVLQSAESAQSSVAVQSVAAYAYSNSDQDSDSSESEFSETASEASDSAETQLAERPGNQVSGNAAVDKPVITDQVAALQLPGIRSSPSYTLDSIPAATDTRGGLDEQSQDRVGDLVATKTKKKWHIW